MLHCSIGLELKSHYYYCCYPKYRIVLILCTYNNKKVLQINVYKGNNL